MSRSGYSAKQVNASILSFVFSRLIVPVHDVRSDFCGAMQKIFSQLPISYRKIARVTQCIMWIATIRHSVRTQEH